MTPPSPQLLAVVLQELPTAVALVRAVFAKTNPDVPVPTSEEVLAAYHTAVATTLATDAAILAAHPDGV